jgi:hypothetical protein
VNTDILEHALQLTRSMLAAARAQEWSRLIELEVEREPLLLRRHASDPTSLAQLGEILAYDRQLQAIVGGARDSAAELWQQETGRARAIAAYAKP